MSFLISRSEVDRRLDELSTAIDSYEKVKMPEYIERWLDVTDAHLELEMLVERLYTELKEERELSRAQQELLREHYGYVYVRRVPSEYGHTTYVVTDRDDPEGIQVAGTTTACSDPQQYGTDCGKCLRCRSITTGGALR